MPKSNPKVRRVKAWAVVFKGKICELLEVDKEDGQRVHFDIYKTRREAKSIKYRQHEIYQVIPCTITYSPPKKTE